MQFTVLHDEHVRAARDPAQPCATCNGLAGNVIPTRRDRDLCIHVLRSTRVQRLLVVATFRNAPADVGAALRDMLPELRRRAGVEERRHAAIRQAGGNLSDKDALRAALRNAKFDSVRGTFRFNRNHFPIQDWYVREVVDDGDSTKSSTLEKIFTATEDRFADQCGMK